MENKKRYQELNLQCYANLFLLPSFMNISIKFVNFFYWIKNIVVVIISIPILYIYIYIFLIIINNSKFYIQLKIVPASKTTYYSRTIKSIRSQ